jgi:hypothetical protein
MFNVMRFFFIESIVKRSRVKRSRRVNNQQSGPKPKAQGPTPSTQAQALQTYYVLSLWRKDLMFPTVKGCTSVCMCFKLFRLCNCHI